MKDKYSEWTSYSSAIIKTSHIHQFDSNNSIQLFIYLDKDSEYAQKLTKKYLTDKNVNDLKDSEIGKISTTFFKRLLVINNCEELFKGFFIIIEHLINFEIPLKKDKRITEAISFISKQQMKQFKVKDVANYVCLSESRLRYLFKRQVGQSIQSFMLWMKVINSLNLILKGGQLTQTAYDVGFWDSSHMTRSYKGLLGITPSNIIKYEKNLKIILCDSINFYTFKTEILKDWNSKKPLKTIEI